jgi:hypothetical protein
LRQLDPSTFMTEIPSNGFALPRSSFL